MGQSRQLTTSRNSDSQKSHLAAEPEHPDCLLTSSEEQIHRKRANPSAYRHHAIWNVAPPSFEAKVAKSSAESRRTTWWLADQGAKWASEDRFFLEPQFANHQVEFFRQSRRFRKLVRSTEPKRNQTTFKAQGPSTKPRTWIPLRCRSEFTVRRLRILRRFWNRNRCSWL